MRNTEQATKRHLGITALALALLGCGAQASAGSVQAPLAQAGAQASGSELQQQPTESNYDRESREEALVAVRNGSSLPGSEPAPAGAASEAQKAGARADTMNQRRAKHPRRVARREQSDTPASARHNKQPGSDNGPAKAKKEED